MDLAWRGQSTGWRCICVPTARVFHKHSATAIEGSARKQFLLSRNKVWLVTKNLCGRKWFVLAALILFFDILSVVYSIVSRHDLVALRAKVAAVRGMSGMMRKARQMRSSCRPTASLDLKLIEPAVLPWLPAQRKLPLKPPTPT